MARRKRGRKINGWLILDKPIGMTSNAALGAVKRLFDAQKAGHAGTLDPLGTGLLPIAFGEATKTVPFVVDGRKKYRFSVKWGEKTDSDDSEGSVIATSPLRPDRASIEALLPDFCGQILQRPPSFSAIKLQGERAYDLARAGQEVIIEPREVNIHTLDIVEHDSEKGESLLECTCGKGVYVRAIARDLGDKLGCFGHVIALRRLEVSPFFAKDMILLEKLKEIAYEADASAERLDDILLPVEAALDDIPALAVGRSEAALLYKGRGIIVRGNEIPPQHTPLLAVFNQQAVALGEIDKGIFKPKRLFAGR